VATEKIRAESNEEATVSVQRSIYDPGYVNAMSHFYRGEMGRIMIWRQRLDITTNWAITSSTAIITIAFSTREVPHIIFFFNLAIVWVMLWIEARRYRFYDAFRARLRMLEAHFLVPMVMENHELLQGEWKKLVCEDLILPCFKITKLEAMGRRLKRNYVFIFILILVAVDNKNIFAFARADRGYTLVLPRLARGTHTILAGGVGFRRHFHQCDCNHDLRKQEVIRRNFRVWHSPLALADLEKQLAVS